MGGAADRNAVVLLELVQGELLKLGQGMILGADAGHRAVGQGLVAGGLGQILLEGEHDLNLSVHQQVFQGVKGDEPQQGQNGRVLPAQALQSGLEKAQLRRVAAADAQAGGQFMLGLLHSGQGQAGELQNLVGVLGEQISLLGQTDALAGAVE